MEVEEDIEGIHGVGKNKDKKKGWIWACHILGQKLLKNSLCYILLNKYNFFPCLTKIELHFCLPLFLIYIISVFLREPFAILLLGIIRPYEITGKKSILSLCGLSSLFLFLIDKLEKCLLIL